MAVYKRRYNPYVGSLTAEWSRFYVLARYAFADLFKSRVFVTLFIFALLPILGFAGYILLVNNKTVQLLLQLRNVGTLEVNSQFFTVLLVAQTQLAFLLNCWVGPTLVSGDLTNGALALFLSRPFSRAEYVLGKLAVLAILLSVVTWIPGLFLFGLQSGLATRGWLWSHLWMTVPIVFCSAIWILMLSLVSLAISAWFKLRIVATGVTFIAFVIPAAIGGIFNAIMHTAWGTLLNFPELFRRIVTHAFRDDVGNLRVSGWNDIPIPMAWAMLLLVCIFALFLLNARLRAREVVRG
jgi:ABC-2 type transport system permease protein